MIHHVQKVIKHNTIVGKILVSWDHYSRYMETKKMFQTTSQISNRINSVSRVIANGYLPSIRFEWPMVESEDM